MRSLHIKALLIRYLILLSQGLKMTSSMPKHVAMFSSIVYIIKVCYAKIILLISSTHLSSIRSSNRTEQISY